MQIHIKNTRQNISKIEEIKENHNQAQEITRKMGNVNETQKIKTLHVQIWNSQHYKELRVTKYYIVIITKFNLYTGSLPPRVMPVTTFVLYAPADKPQKNAVVTRVVLGRLPGTTHI